MCNNPKLDLVNMNAYTGVFLGLDQTILSENYEWRVILISYLVGP